MSDQRTIMLQDCPGKPIQLAAIAGHPETMTLNQQPTAARVVERPGTG
jgi:hypothetical protein